VPKWQTIGIAVRGLGEAGHDIDYLPRELLETVVNIGDFARALVLDKWTCNSDGRQAIFWKAPRKQRYAATFIDQGYCFNAGEWTFPDSPLRGTYANNCVYERVVGWEAFEPALSRAEEMDAHAIWRCAVEIPEEWFEGDRDAYIGWCGGCISAVGDSEVDRRVSPVEPESVSKLA
jgi:hypothetical protein